MAPADASVHAILVVRPVARDRGYRARDLVEQGADLVTVVNLAARQRCGDDLARVGIHTEMQFSPGPALAGRTGACSNRASRPATRRAHTASALCCPPADARARHRA